MKKALGGLLGTLASVFTILTALGWLPPHADSSPGPIVTPVATPHSFGQPTTTVVPTVPPVKSTPTPAVAPAPLGSTTVAGQWHGSLFQQRTDFSTDTVMYALNLVQSAGGIGGVSLLTLPFTDALAGSSVSHEVRGTLAGQRLHLDDSGIVATNNQFAGWCTKSIDLSLSQDGGALSGSWRSADFNCGSGSIDLNRGR
jgi:hypothetical protein